MSHAFLSAAFFRRRTRPDLVIAMERFRKDFFVDELGWALPVAENREADAFDTDAAIYCVLIGQGKIVGCFRAIPCNEPYLARQIFGYLATERAYPKSSDYIEISRLGAVSSDRRLSALLYALMLRLGFALEAKALVALADLSHERLLNKIGLRTVRYGDEQIVGYREDGSWLLGVAGEIPLARSADISRILSLAETVEVIDAASVLGREPVLA